MELLSTKNLSKSYSDICVLNKVNFRLEKGEVHALVGENGAGKTTLIKLLAGVIKPDAGGEILVEGKPVAQMTPLKSRQLGISVIYQDISLFPDLSVAENICAGLKQQGIHSPKKVMETARETLKLMGLTMDCSARLSDISIGQQQLVAIARAITFHAKVMIMDEPTAALSSGEVRILYNIIRLLKERGLGIIYISHKFDEIFAVADRVTVLRDGHLIASDAVTAFDRQKLINLIAGKELLYAAHLKEGQAGEALFEADRLTSEPFFRDISFKVFRNEILGITGLVGAGRSELAQGIFGLLPLHRGAVRLHGKTLKISSAKAAISRGICYLPEDRHAQGLFMPCSLRVNINAANLKRTVGRHHLISRKIENRQALHYIDSLKIKPSATELPVRHFSGGNQQKVLVGRWLNAEPKVLIVDEVTSGVDVAVKAEIHKLLRSLANNGIAVIVISSDLDEVLAICDRILVMRQGSISGELHSESATQQGILDLSML